MNSVSSMTKILCLVLLSLVGGALTAQNPPAQPTGELPPAAAPPAEGAFTKEQLEQLVAPIALYPDGLLSQVFMAATYPLQVVDASRVMEANPSLKGDQLNAKLKEQEWDEAVKSMCTFPDVLKKMSDNLDWTQDLGDALLGQQTELLDAVQTMRAKAYKGGTLESTDQIVVNVEQPDPAEPQIIVIESKNPEVVYVPQYAPTVMYPGWGYPSYYYPAMYPYYPPGAGFWSFTAGVIVGGAIWGNCNWGWGGSDIDIDVDRNFNFNNNTNINGGNRISNTDRSSWQHNAQNRKGVNYRDGATAQKYGGTGASSRVTSAEARGRSATTASTQQAGTTAGTRQTGAASGDRAAAAQDRAGAAREGGAASGDRAAAAGDRAAGSRQSSAAAGDRAAGGSREGASSASRPASSASRDSGASARSSSAGSASRASSSSSRPSASSSSRSGAYSGSRSSGMDRASSSRGSMSRSGGYSGGGFSRGGGGGMSRGGGGGRRR